MVQLANPYKAPESSTENEATADPVLTRQRVFWFGLGAVGGSLALVTGSQALYVAIWPTRSWYAFFFVIDGIAALTFVAGLISLVVYHWFPDLRRKFSWRHISESAVERKRQI